MNYSKQHYKEICIVISRIARINNLNEKQINDIAVEFISYFKRYNNDFNEIAFRALLDRLIEKPLIKGVE